MSSERRPSDEKRPNFDFAIDLPPLDGDELFEIDQDDMVNMVDTDFDADTSDDGAPIPEVDNASFLTDFDESSWIDDGRSASIDIDLSEGIDESEDWAPLDDETSGPDVGDWFVAEEGEPTITDDGAEGPLQSEAFEIEDANWAALDDGEDDPDEDIMDTMERLGMADLFSETDSTTGFEAPCATAEVTFLGPEEGRVRVSAFSGDWAMAAGDSVYVLGVDDMFHPLASRRGHLGAVSLADSDGELFIGTEHDGLLISPDRGATLTPLNRWYTHGLTSEGVTPDKISTRFAVSGQPLKDGYRLCGVTGTGQLYWSLDRGANWQGPVAGGRFASVAPIRGTESLLALVAIASVGHTLMTSDDAVTWHELTIPAGLRAQLQTGRAVLGGCGSFYWAGGLDSEGPLYRTLDKGRTWHVLPDITHVTAVVGDREDPSWIAAATVDRDNRRADVVVSRDSGDTWQTVLVVDAHREERLMEGAQRISALSTSRRHPRRLMAVCDRGVYLIVFQERPLAH